MAPLRLPSVPWDKINLMEIVLPAPFSYPQRFSIPETSDTPKASLTKILSTVSWKVFDGELLYSPSPRPTLTSNNLFVIRNLLKHRGVPLRSVSLLRNKHFWSTVVTPRPFLSLFFFHLENFLKHGRVPLRNLLVLWNKKVLRRIVIPLPFLCMKNFDARFVLKRGSVPQWNVSVLWGEKTDEDPDAHPLSFS